MTTHPKLVSIRPPLPRLVGRFLLLLSVFLIASCGGDAEVSVDFPGDGGPPVSGIVELPNRGFARASSFGERFASLLIAPVEAISSADVLPVSRNVVVQIIRIRTSDIINGQIDSRNVQFIGFDSTNDQGQYLVGLPSGFDENTQFLVVQTCQSATQAPTVPCDRRRDPTTTQGFVYSTLAPIRLNFQSDAALQTILASIPSPSDLTEFGAQDFRNVFEAVLAAPGEIECPNVSECNQRAFEAVRDDPAVQNAIAAALGVAPPTVPTRTRTATVPPTVTPTRTATSPVVPDTTTPTRTNTATPTSTGEVTPPTPTATQTPTSTVRRVPRVDIGSASGPPGSSVNVDFSITKNGFNIVTVAPLEITFNPAILSVQSCTSLASGKQATIGIPDTNVLRVVVAGDLSIFADGPFVRCTFRVAAGATPGTTPLTFVSADMSDDEFNDIAATGTNGSITVTEVTAPSIAIGSDSGPRGSLASIEFSLATNGFSIITIAPVTVEFDSAALRFDSCVSMISGKPATAGVPVTGVLNVVVAGNLAQIPDGVFMHCVFEILPGAPLGSTPLTFRRAELSDPQFNDVDAVGTSGSVTVTEGPRPPRIDIGSTQGMRGESVSIDFTLTNNDFQVVTIAPIEVRFDPAAISFVSCESLVAGKDVTAGVPDGGRARIVLAGGLSAVPDGTFMRCTFEISGSAPRGVTPLIFGGAEMSDAQFSDILGVGRSGVITVNGN